MPLASNSACDHSMGAYIGIKTGLRESKDDALPSTSGMSESLKSVKGNINVQQDCTNKKKRKRIALYFCIFCTKSFSSKGARTKHNNKEHGIKKKHTCIECGMSFAYELNLNIHMDLEHNNKECRYKCPECIKSFDLLRNIKIHMMKVHKLTLTLHEIDVMKKTKSLSLNKDQASIFGTIKIDEYIDSVGGLDIGNDTIKNYLCPGMNEGCDDLEELEKSALLCEDVTSKCLDNLNVEQEITDDNDTNIRLRCCYCGQRFSKELYHFEHIRDQHRGKNIEHICFLCGAIFTAYFNLKRHWHI